jgi:hypothetical protein
MQWSLKVKLSLRAFENMAVMIIINKF